MSQYPDALYQKVLAAVRTQWASYNKDDEEEVIISTRDIDLKDFVNWQRESLKRLTQSSEQSRKIELHNQST